MNNMDRIYAQSSNRFYPTQLQTKAKQVQTASNPFQTILRQQIDSQNELKISKHAEKRLEERGISIEPEKWQVIQNKVQEAKQKGVNDSLVILNNAALIVNAKNNTVVTAMNRNETEGQLFTNINGTILID